MSIRADGGRQTEDCCSLEYPLSCCPGWLLLVVLFQHRRGVLVFNVRGGGGGGGGNSAVVVAVVMVEGGYAGSKFCEHFICPE